MWKKITGGIFLVIGIFAGVYWYSYTKEIRTPVSMAINAVPNNAAFILESKQINDIWAKISATNVMWEQLLSIESISKLNNQIKYIEQLLNKNSDVKKLLERNSIFISAHVSGAYSYDFLFTTSLPSVREESTVQDFFNSINIEQEIASKSYDGIDISRIKDKNNDSVSFAFYQGVLMISSKQSLVESAIRQLKSGISFKTDNRTAKIFSTAGKNVDLNLYINYRALSDVLARFISPELGYKLHALSDFAYFSGWDVGVKPNALTFNGFTQANDSPGNFLSLFANQKPQEIKLTKILPSNVSFMMFWGISNIKMFHHDYKKYLSNKRNSQSYEKRISDVNSKYHIDIESTMLEWNNNEIALVITEGHSTDFSENTYAVIHSNDINDASLRLSALADTINKKDKLRIDTIKFRDHVIYHLNLPNLIPLIYGESFIDIVHTHFCVIGDYVVFGNSKEALKTFVNSIENDKTLENDKSYKDFSDNISTDASVYFYTSICRSNAIYAKLANEEIVRSIEKNAETINKFEAFGLQFTYSNNLFYSNAYLSYNPLNKEQNTTLWEIKLDAPASSTPYLLLNHNTKNKEVFVQDRTNKIYLISNTGKVLWSKQLEEKIISNVVQVDAFKNQKLQILFNTRSAIHAIDRNGKDVAGYPVKLKSPATAGISVFDYDNNRNYRIFIPCESKKIICYDVNGKEIKGFTFDQITSLVNQSVQYFKFGNKDLLCAVDEKGKVYLANRKGESVHRLTEHLYAINQFFIEEGKDEKNTFIVGCDSLGNVMKINLNNEKETFQIVDSKAKVHFNYTDITGDGVKEYIFIIGDKLEVYTQNKQLLFEHEFNNIIARAPFVIKQNDKFIALGVVSEQSSEVFLFDGKGQIYKGFPMESSTPFCIGDINNDGLLNIILIGTNGNVYAYE
jgi:hypothetical protein